MVAPGDLGADAARHRGRRVAQARGPRQLGQRPQRLALEGVGLAARHQAVRARQRLVGAAPGDRHRRIELRRHQVGVVHHAVAIVQHLGGEELRVVGQRHVLDAPFHLRVVVEIELDFGDHADRAVAADRGREQLGVLLAAGLDDAAVGQHQLQGPHRVADRAMPDIAAMAVDRHRAADREVGKALHRAHRQVVRIEHVLQVAPGDAGLHPHPVLGGAQPEHPLHLPHVQVQPAGDGDLAAHAVAAAADRHLARPVAQRAHDRFGVGRRLDARDLDRVQAGDVLDRNRQRRGERDQRRELAHRGGDERPG